MAVMIVTKYTNFELTILMPPKVQVLTSVDVLAPADL
jgi:hypothetical protein